MASLRQQYGLKVKSGEFSEMGWDEFSDLVSGLNEATPLVRVAQIRTETDAERVREMTADQRRMRSEWQRKRAMRMPQSDVTAFLSSIQKAFEQTLATGEGGEDDG